MPNRTEFPPREVLRVMDQTLRDQVSPGWNDRLSAISRYIFDEGLLRLTQWPGWVISITPAGIAYRDEHADGDSEEDED